MKIQYVFGGNLPDWEASVGDGIFSAHGETPLDAVIALTKLLAAELGCEEEP